VLTVDQFQGRDKDCIVLSLVRSNSAGATGSLLSEWRRINVALTRARKKIVIVGSYNTFCREALHASTCLPPPSSTAVTAPASLGIRSMEVPVYAAVQEVAPSVSCTPQEPSSSILASCLRWLVQKGWALSLPSHAHRTYPAYAPLTDSILSP